MQAATANIIPESVSKDVPNSLIDIESKLDAILGVIPTTEELQKLNPTQDKANNLTAEQIHAMGSDVKTALQISKAQGQQFDFATLKNAGYTASELKAGGFTNASVYKQNNVSYTEAKTAFTNQELSKAGYSEATQALTAEAAAKQKAEQEKAAAAAAQRQANITAYNNYMAARKKDKKLSGTQVDELIRLGGLIGKGPRTVLNEIVGGSGADPFTWENIMGALLKSKTVTRWNLAATYGSSSNAVKKLFEHLKINTKKEKDAFWKEYNQKKPKALAYASGGLADYTGPAWLDGTPSKPELVLNSTDTKNFIALKDVLSKAMGSTNAIENSYGGDTTFEININVDHLNNDYDVDKVAERVKKIIVKDSSYRNVTQVRNFR